MIPVMRWLALGGSEIRLDPRIQLRVITFLVPLRPSPSVTGPARFVLLAGPVRAASEAGVAVAAMDLGKRRLRSAAFGRTCSVVLASPRPERQAEHLSRWRCKFPVLDAVHALAQLGDGALHVLLVERQVHHGVPRIERLADEGLSQFRSASRSSGGTRVAMMAVPSKALLADALPDVGVDVELLLVEVASAFFVPPCDAARSPRTPPSDASHSCARQFFHIPRPESALFVPLFTGLGARSMATQREPADPEQGTGGW
jgi:hypothetical protein